ncbi:MAG: peptidylprolyl isomerase [Sphingobacteriales bacterium]|jgi:FKBP-type peptidyl-prolyl cis-trans isomerase SlyD|nr:peptidylprolyl isomerase [Sphingobacteriales bacterium]
MIIQANAVVSVRYILHSSQGMDQDRTLVEESNEENPLTFLVGSGQLIPGFERNMLGLTIGDSFSFSLACDEAYGNLDQEALVRVPDEMFKQDGILDLEILRIGNMVPLLDRDGNQLVARVAGIDGTEVLLDFNHPLAGHDLHFSGSILSVRNATEEEIEHGHSHGPGGHSH